MQQTHSTQTTVTYSSISLVVFANHGTHVPFIFCSQKIHLSVYLCRGSGWGSVSEPRSDIASIHGGSMPRQSRDIAVLSAVQSRIGLKLLWLRVDLDLHPENIQSLYYLLPHCHSVRELSSKAT